MYVCSAPYYCLRCTLFLWRSLTYLTPVVQKVPKAVVYLIPMVCLIMQVYLLMVEVYEFECMSMVHLTMLELYLIFVV